MPAIWSSIVIDPNCVSLDEVPVLCVSAIPSIILLVMFCSMYDSLRLNNSSYHVDYRWIECNYCTSHGIQSLIDTLFLSTILLLHVCSVHSKWLIVVNFFESFKHIAFCHFCEHNQLIQIYSLHTHIYRLLFHVNIITIICSFLSNFTSF